MSASGEYWPCCVTAKVAQRGLGRIGGAAPAGRQCAAHRASRRSIADGRSRDWPGMTAAGMAKAAAHAGAAQRCSAPCGRMDREVSQEFVERSDVFSSVNCERQLRLLRNCNANFGRSATLTCEYTALNLLACTAMT